MNRNKFRFLLLTIIGFLIYSCQKDDDFINSDINRTDNKENSYKFGDKVILGKQLENPYSVENMTKAYQNIKKSTNQSAKSSSSSSVVINTTHHYVKFIPDNTEDLKYLEADSTLIVYDYPLDYEILQMGDYYHDPEVSLNKPTYQYASIAINETIPSNIQYEILADLYIPDEEDLGEELADLLVDEALLITNNLEPEEQNSSATSQRASKWRPAGKIRVWDDVIGSTTSSTRVFDRWEYYDCDTGEILSRCPSNNGDEIELDPMLKLAPEPCCKRPIYRYITTTTQGSYIPMNGVKVRARRWFTTHTGITNAEGNYSCNGRFRRPANYKIKWKRHNFSIWWSWLSSAKYNGPKQRGNWNLNIRGGHQEYYATVFRGAHLYYYGNMFGLTRPKHQTALGGRLVINAKTENETDSYSHERSLALGADIVLKEWGNPSDEVFGTTIHELAHAAHREVDNSAYNSLKWKAYVSPWFSLGETWQNPGPTGRNAKRLMETWASTVENFIVTDRYLNFYNVTNYTYENNLLQTQTIADENFYTSCGIDMIDNFNQRTTSILRPIDNVDGYTINQLENALNGATTWIHWRDNLINNEANDTEPFLNELFANWTN